MVPVGNVVWDWIREVERLVQSPEQILSIVKGTEQSLFLDFPYLKSLRNSSQTPCMDKSALKELPDLFVRCHGMAIALPDSL